MFSISHSRGVSEMSMGMIQARKDRRGKRAELPDDIAKRLKSCSVLNCEDWRDLSSYTTYHCFPTGDKNQDRWEIWTQLLRKAREEDTWIPFRGSLVCSHHFRPEDFVNDPLSKRRKLTKNAIPSIFPEFTVDLEDPSYQVSDDPAGEYEGDYDDGTANYDDSNEYQYGDGNSFTDADAEFLEGYYSSANNDQEGFSEVQTTMPTGPDFSNFENDEDDDIAVIEAPDVPGRYSQKLSINQINKLQPNQPFKKMSTAISVSSDSRTTQIISNDKLVQNRGATANANNNVTLKRKSSLGGIPSTGMRKQLPRHVPTVSPASSSQSRFQRNSIQEEEIASSLNSLSYSLNPDLQIELIDPVEELAVSRQRISDLEQENRSLTIMYENTLGDLKHKYESQISLLRKRLQQQEKLLANNQLSGGLSGSTTKKVRLS